MINNALIQSVRWMNGQNLGDTWLEMPFGEIKTFLTSDQIDRFARDHGLVCTRVTTSSITDTWHYTPVHAGLKVNEYFDGLDGYPEVTFGEFDLVDDEIGARTTPAIHFLELLVAHEPPRRSISWSYWTRKRPTPWRSCCGG